MLETVTISLEKYENMRKGLDIKIKESEDKALRAGTLLSNMTIINKKLQEILEENFNCVIKDINGDLKLINKTTDTQTFLIRKSNL